MTKKRSKEQQQAGDEEKIIMERTEKDVLSGRGNRICNWPGNIYFRQVVSRYRDEYMKASRSRKVEVADKILAAIHKTGGKFLKEVSSGKYVELAKDRAAEKTCQALREREKSSSSPNAAAASSDASPNSPTNKKKKKKLKVSSSPSSNEKSPPPAQPKSKKKSGIKRRGSHTSSQSGKHKDNNSNNKKKKVVAGGKVVAGNAAAAEGSSDGGATSGSAGAITTKKRRCCPIDLLRDVSIQEDMLNKLVNFKTAYGHCGVPPGWPYDSMFADWCTAQRQIFREIDVGYRDATENEERIIQRLNCMDFVWDYADWHWQDRYEKLKECRDATTTATKATSKNNDNSDDDGDKTYNNPQNVVDWLQDQRCQIRTGSAGISTERINKLRQMGITL